MPKTLNIAVIGAGTMAQAVHLPVLRRRWDRFAVTALVDHSPRRRRESSEVWGIEEERRYEAVPDLIAAVRAKSVAVDAALLSTDGLHVEDLLALMRRGIPVLVEPPIGFSADEVARVVDFERMTGRRLVMMAYPQQYDDSVSLMTDNIATKDLRMIDHEVLMPASQPLYGGAHVTSSAYDLPTEVRSQRRTDLQVAVVAGAGEGATQRDRDLYVKGLLTGAAHQLAVLEASYGPLTGISAVRHWPKGVIPGSIEILGELEGGARVRAVWHYLPFAPEYSEHVQVLSARRRMRVELPAPSHGDQRSTVSLREKKAGVVVETSTTATKGSAELMWEAFHNFVDRGTRPISGSEEARAQVLLMRQVLEAIVSADGRSLDPEPEEQDEQGAGAALPTGGEEHSDGEEQSDDEARSGRAEERPGDAEEQPGDEVPAGDPGPSEAAVPGQPAADDEPTSDEPAADDPTSDEPASEEPAADQPSADPPALGAPSASSEQTTEILDVWNLESDSAPARGADGPAPRQDEADGSSQRQDEDSSGNR